MDKNTFAVFVSFASLLMAAFAVGWNVYRDIIQKPKLKLSLMFGFIATADADPKSDAYRRVILTVTNFGPGKTAAKTIMLRQSSLLKRLFKKAKRAFMMPDYEDPYSGKIPVKLEVGEEVTLTFRIADNLFLLKDDLDQIGITDPFGNTHWCKKSDYKRVKSEYLDYRNGK